MGCQNNRASGSDFSVKDINMASVTSSEDTGNIKVKKKSAKKTKAMLKKTKKSSKKKKSPAPPLSPPGDGSESDSFLQGGNETDKQWAGAFTCSANGNTWMYINLCCCPCLSLGYIWDEYEEPGGFYVGCCCQCPCCWHMLREKVAIEEGIEDDRIMSVLCPCCCPCLNCSQLIMTANANSRFDGFALQQNVKEGSKEPGLQDMSRVPLESPEKRTPEKGTAEKGTPEEGEKKGKVTPTVSNADGE